MRWKYLALKPRMKYQFTFAHWFIAILWIVSFGYMITGIINQDMYLSIRAWSLLFLTIPFVVFNQNRLEMSIGDEVVTKEGEHGTIVKSASGCYDWWVELEFMLWGECHKSRIPYRESELAKVR